MPYRESLFEVSALSFREAIRPSLLGNIGAAEPMLAELCGNALELWLYDVIQKTVAGAAGRGLHDRNDNILTELMTNARVYGRYSLAYLRGIVYAYPWIKIHEYGGDIHPTGDRQFLAIPIYNALRSDGSPKFRNPSSWERFGSFVYKSKTGKLFLAYKAADGTLKILYILVDKVTIPARLELNVTAWTMLPALWNAWARIYVEVASEVMNFNPFVI